MNGFPYWQFHCDRWLAGKVSAFDLNGQGLFLHFCMSSWIARGPFDICPTTLRLKFKVTADWVKETANAMCDVGILIRDGDKYRIKFIDEQLADMDAIRVKRSTAGRASAAAREEEKKEEVSKGKVSSVLTSVQQTPTPVEHMFNTCSTHVEQKVLKRPENIIPPVYEDVIALGKSLGNENAAEDFWLHFKSNGWKVSGKTPMKDWHSALKKWIRNNSPGGAFFRPLKDNERSAYEKPIPKQNLAGLS